MGTILVADDDVQMCALLVAVLEDVGYHALVAASGRATVELAVAHHPDIVVLDLLMPAMDGFAVCRALKADPRTVEIPVVLLTGLSQTPSKLEGFACGATDYITKPFDLTELTARLRVVLHEKSRRDALMAEVQQLRQVVAGVAPGAAVAGHVPPGRLHHTRGTGPALTPRQQAILTGLIARRTQPRIAVEECLGLRTVEREISALRGLFAAPTTAALVAEVMRLGLLS